MISRIPIAYDEMKKIYLSIITLDDAFIKMLLNILRQNEKLANIIEPIVDLHYKGIDKLKQQLKSCDNVMENESHEFDINNGGAE